jgi:starch synthase
MANPRILIVTPEVTYLPDRMKNMANYLTAKAGGLADVSAALIKALFDQGADVHVALPDYRAIFRDRLAPFLKKELNAIQRIMPDDSGENTKLSLAFQREVINNIIPRVQPDLIHCNDWMTGLIPALAREGGIPCLFTIHNIHTVKTLLSSIEDRGIDAAYFWRHLYYVHYADEYEKAREANPVDFLVSGVFAAHFVNTVSPTFLKEIIEGRHDFVEPPLKEELYNKWHAGCAAGILNAPDPSFDPETDQELYRQYNAKDHPEGKKENKRYLQREFGLIQDDKAPIFFWPSRLDTRQKGCQLLSEILYKVVAMYWKENIQFLFVANGEFQKHFRDIVNYHGIHQQVAICDFNEWLEHLAYGAADFVLMPSLFEPCGLPQMIGVIYGALPVVNDTGGLHDTVVPLDVKNNSGNGFIFETYNSGGLLWAIQEAMKFYKLPAKIKAGQIERIMTESAARFNHDVTAQQYIELYEKMLQRPLITSPF